MMKIIYILLASLGLFACQETVYQDVMREVEIEKPTAVHHYYSHTLGDKIGPAMLGHTASTFTPGCIYVHKDTMIIANTQVGNFSVELYSLSGKNKIASLNKWTYKGEEQTFNGLVEAIAVSNGRLYLGNRESCIDVFDLKTLEFITRIGDRVAGETSTQLNGVHAMAISGDYIVVRTKTQLQVILQSEVDAESYQDISFYARSSTDGFDVNNSLNSHQMVVDSLGTIYLADNGEMGNRKIHVIDTSLIKRGENLVLTNDQKLELDFFPRGIALYKDVMYIAGFGGDITIYDRNKKEFLTTFRSVVGYAFKGLQKLFIDGDRLWVQDFRTKEVVGLDIFQGSIEEYE